MAKTLAPEQNADAALGVGNAERGRDLRHQIRTAPAHDAVHRRIRVHLDPRRQLFGLGWREPTRRPRRGAIDQALRPLGIEALDPVPERLAVHPAGPRRITPARPFDNQRQKPPALRAIAARRRQPAQILRAVIPTRDLNRSRNGTPPTSCPDDLLNHIIFEKVIPYLESATASVGISRRTSGHVALARM